MDTAGIGRTPSARSNKGPVPPEIDGDYKNDLYFGLDEYLQLCEDLGAEPVYVTSAGISEVPEDKEWFGLCPLDKMQPIIADILDLLDYCNGRRRPLGGPNGRQTAIPRRIISNTLK